MTRRSAFDNGAPNGYEEKPGQWVRCWFRWRDGLVEDLKAGIPARYRRWSPEERSWHVAPEAWPAALKVFGKYGLFAGAGGSAGADHSSRGGGSPGAGGGAHGQPSDWGALYLVPGAPVEVIRASYAALSKKYHPDRVGGDPTGKKQQELNDAYHRVLRQMGDP